MCNCSSSKGCVVGYCSCFSNGNLCSNKCNCKDCKNNEESPDRNSKYTRLPKFIGCKCYRACNKNYCVCRKRGQKCTDDCRCSRHGEKCTNNNQPCISTNTDSINTHNPYVKSENKPYIIKDDMTLAEYLIVTNKVGPFCISRSHY